MLIVQVVAIEAAVPALEELHLCDNSLTALGPSLLMCPVTAGAPAHMRLLFPRLRVFPPPRLRLCSPTLIRCMRAWLSFDNCSRVGCPSLLKGRLSFVTQGWAFLRHLRVGWGFFLQVLNLARNSLSTWDEIRHVSMLPSLTALNVSSNGLPDLEQPLHSGEPPGLKCRRSQAVATSMYPTCSPHFSKLLQREHCIDSYQPGAA